jgi:hypothetical protein
VFRVQGSGFRVQDSGFRVQGSGFRIQGSGFRIQGSGIRVHKCLMHESGGPASDICKPRIENRYQENNHFFVFWWHVNSRAQAAEPEGCFLTSIFPSPE